MIFNHQFLPNHTQQHKHDFISPILDKIKQKRHEEKSSLNMFPLNCWGKKLKKSISKLFQTGNKSVVQTIIKVSG